MGRKCLYLAQVNWSNCSGNTPGHWLPYSVGSLWAYCQQNLEIREEYELGHILFQRVKIADALELFRQPSIVGFSCYVWNTRYNLELASRLKARWPDCLIVFGGPQVPDSSEAYFGRFPFV